MLQMIKTKNNNSPAVTVHTQTTACHTYNILDCCLTGRTFHAQYGLVTDRTLLTLPEVVHLAQDRVHYRKFVHRVAYTPCGVR